MFGHELKKIRESLGLTQEQFAPRLGVTTSTLSKWERGEHEPCTQDCRKIAKKLGVSVTVLVKDDEE
jgi:transcriptional regulator with XRE-family HTH domain